MALIGNPDILVLNEPFGELDTQAVEDFKSLLKMIGGVKCVVLATSMADGVEDICKNVAVIVGGKLLINDTIENINEKINGVRTMLIRVISKDENENGDITEYVKGVEGVTFSSVRSVSEQGEVILKLEYKPDCDTGAIMNVFKDNGYIVLSHEEIKLSINDICLSATKSKEEEK